MFRMSFLAAMLSGAFAHGADDRPAPDSPEALDAYEAALLTPPHLQPMSYGGGLEWSLAVEGNCRLYVREFGDRVNETWVILHGGFGAEHSYLLPAFMGLETDHHLVFYDQRGSLRSHCPIEEISLQAHVEDLDRLRQALGQERINLIGHSAGAHLAMRYFDRYPENAGAFILLAPADLKTFDTDEERAAFEAATVRDMTGREEVGALAAAHGLDGDPADLGPRERTLRWRLTYGSSSLRHLERFELVRGGDVFYNEAAGIAASRTGTWPVNFVGPLKVHPFPVSVILGDHDTLIDRDGALHRHWFEDDPNVTLTLIKDAGHTVWLDQPRAFRRALVRALAAGGAKP